MHLKDDTLRAFADRELPENQARLAQEHLSRCPACQVRLEELSGRARAVRERLDVLAPGPLEQARSPRLAYQRFARSSNMQHRKENNLTMLTKRPLWTALTVLIVLVLVFTLTPASAWANSFLSMFRVQKVQVITFDPSAAENARTQLEANQSVIEQALKDNLKITHTGESAKVTGAEEAAAKAGFTPRLPAALGNAELTVRPGMNGVLTIDQPKFQELIDLAGIDYKLPAELNGKKVIVNVASSVIASSGCPSVETEKQIPAGCTALVQVPSPVVETPDGLDMTSMGQAMFQFLGLSPAEARQLSQRIDWTSTLVLPIPQSGEVQYQDVKVDGVTGTLLTQPDRGEYALIWIKDGMLYGLSGSGSADEALNVAGSLK